jgi:hypothetical protein
MTVILGARQRVQVKQIDLAAAVGRSIYWIEQVEQGKKQITPEEQSGILRAISRIAAFEQAMLRKRQEFLAGLKLSETRSAPGR